MTAESCGVRTVKSELMTLEGSVQEEESREKGKLHLGFQVRRRLGWGSYPVRILTAVTRCSGQRNNIDRMRRFDTNQVPRETKCFSNPMCTQIIWETDCDSIGLRAQDCISSHLQSNADNHSEHQSQMPKNYQEHQRTTGGGEVAKWKQHRWWTIVGEEHSPSCLWDGPGLSKQSPMEKHWHILFRKSCFEMFLDACSPSSVTEGYVRRLWNKTVMSSIPGSGFSWCVILNLLLNPPEPWFPHAQKCKHHHLPHGTIAMIKPVCKVFSRVLATSQVINMPDASINN